MKFIIVYNFLEECGLSILFDRQFTTKLDGTQKF